MTALWAARLGLREERYLITLAKADALGLYKECFWPNSNRCIRSLDICMTICVLPFPIGTWPETTQLGMRQSEEALNLRHAAHKKLSKWFEKYAFKDSQKYCIRRTCSRRNSISVGTVFRMEKLQSSLTRQKMLVAILIIVVNKSSILLAHT